MSLKVSTVVIGANRAALSFRLMNAETRVRVRGVIQETTEAVTRRAQANAPISGPEDRKAKNRPGPGELRDTIRSSFSLDGMIGSVMAGFGKIQRRSRAKGPKKQGPLRLAAFLRERKRAALKAQRDLGVYAMVINYGSPGRGIPATHFMDRAKEAERMPHISRLKAALQQAADTVERVA